MKKYYIVVLVSIILTLSSLLYVEKCKVGGGIMSFCTFGNTRGLPLPFLGMDNISLLFLLIDFIFWLILISLVYIIIFYITKFIKLIIKK